MSQGKFSDIPYYLLDEYYSKMNTYTSGDVKEVNINAGYLTFVDTDIMKWESNDGYLDWDGRFNYVGADTSNSGLRGMEISINTNGSSWTLLYAKIPSVGFKRIKLKQFPDDTWKNENTLHYEISDRPETTSGIFKVGEDPGFEWEESYEHVWIDDKTYAVIAKKVETENSSFTLYKQKLVSSVATSIEPGTELYFRKDSAFHFWFKKYKKYEKSKSIQRTEVSDTWDHEDFINDRVIYLYFGKVYNNIKSEKWRNIQYYSLKDFAINILPENNQTTMYKKWLWESYDKAHFEQWNVQKNIPTLLDVDEISLKYLGYLSKFYGYDIDTNIIEENRQRLLVKSLIYQLKRKGAWTGILTAWKVLSGNTMNMLNLYELWHPTEIFKKKTVEEKIPRKANNIISNFNMGSVSDNGFVFNDDIEKKPVIDINVDITEGKIPLRVRVEAVLENGEYSKINWDFGDGSNIGLDASQGKYTYYIYTTPGDYVLKQTITERSYGDVVLYKNIKVLPNIFYSTLTFKTNRPDLLRWKLDYADIIWHSELSIELPSDSYKIYLKPVVGYSFENFYTIDLHNNETIEVIYKGI